MAPRITSTKPESVKHREYMNRRRARALAEKQRDFNAQFTAPPTTAPEPEPPPPPDPPTEPEQEPEIEPELPEAKHKNEAALPAIYALTKRLIPLRTAVESLGLDFEKYNAWFTRSPARVMELKRIRAVALIDLQEKMITGSQGWQSRFRLIESLEPELWIKQTSAGKKKADVSPYSAAIKKRGR